MKKKIIYIDIDGTICSQTKSDYKNAKPFKSVIKKINQLYNKGNIIVFYTARYMNRKNNNVEEVYRYGYQFTYNQLMSWGLKFHELKMGKPQFDILVDNRVYNYNDSWITKL